MQPSHLFLGSSLLPESVERWREEEQELQLAEQDIRKGWKTVLLWSPAILFYWSTINFTDTVNTKVYTYLPKSKTNTQDKPGEKQNEK